MATIVVVLVAVIACARDYEYERMRCNTTSSEEQQHERAIRQRQQQMNDMKVSTHEIHARELEQRAQRAMTAVATAVNAHRSSNIDRQQHVCITSTTLCWQSRQAAMRKPLNAAIRQTAQLGK